MELLLYLGKVSLYWIVSWGLYRLLLSRHTFFVWNRAYLLLSLLGALLLPFIQYPQQVPGLPEVYLSTLPTFEVTQLPPSPPGISPWTLLIWTLYACGAARAAIRLGRQWQKIGQIMGQGEKIELDQGNLILLNHSHIGSFSFLNSIVINQNDYVHHFEPILRHETVHLQQRHSLDILLVEALRIVFWFNPILLLYKRELQIVHEFLADKDAQNRQHYAHFLLSYVAGQRVTGLTNTFFQSSQIKTRITMLYKKPTSAWMLSSYVVVMLGLGSVALTVAGCQQTSDQKEATLPESIKVEGDQERIDASLEGKKIFAVVEQQPEFPGGQEKLFQFLGDNLKYPEEATRANIEGKVVVSFVVTETGEIGQAKVQKGIGHGCDEEALRVVKAFPKWTPGAQDGQAINVRYVLPINFQLNTSHKTTTQPQAIENLPADKRPMVVIDGQKQDPTGPDPIKTLPPSRIASINVLKGPKAQEAYGAEGANGVIEIKTKAE
ncbi:TonB family protein [Dyadobacter jejuensis]|uniref:TonB family protein n=1 Tax=Dyadobacter jejuensis TaxID=1082580 RepID=A0A316ALC8_9BACT|nr:M56 family metallopeptidase [Dyadobacter jejuensis]PWJ57650.1 TonB family protein [Dyadobacter jejuensis]